MSHIGFVEMCCAIQHLVDIPKYIIYSSLTEQ